MINKLVVLMTTIIIALTYGLNDIGINAEIKEVPESIPDISSEVINNSNIDDNICDPYSERFLDIFFQGNEYTIKSCKPPSLDSDEWTKLNHSENYNGYKVSVNNDEIIVDYADNMESIKRYEVDNGYLEAADYGEFGGYLNFVSDSSEDDYTIINDNIVFIVQAGDKLYAFGGLSHLVIDEGSMYLLEYNKVWTATKVLDIGSSPALVYSEDSSIYIITSSSLILIEDEKIKSVLVEDAFWKGLYPVSVEKYSNELIIGMRGCLCTVSLQTGIIDVYIIDFDY